MGERDLPTELVESGKHFCKNGLHKIFLGSAPRQMRPDNLYDQRVQMLHQTPGGVFVSIAHPRDAGLNVQLRLVHAANLSNTS